MPTMRAPGVYIVERDAFPNSVVQVPTSVTAFVGYTQMAQDRDTSLHLNPIKIRSFADFVRYFGGPPAPVFELTAYDEDDDSDLPRAVFNVGATRHAFRQKTPDFALSAAVRHFYLNGGGDAVIVSVGTFQRLKAGSSRTLEDTPIEASALLAGIAALEAGCGDNLLVVPESTRLTQAEAQEVQTAMLRHAGGTRRFGFALLDIHRGHLHLNKDPVLDFREGLSSVHRDQGAAYYPWVETSVFDARDFTFENLDVPSRGKLVELITQADPGMDEAVRAEIEKIDAPQLYPTGTVPPLDAPFGPPVEVPVHAEPAEITAGSLRIAGPEVEGHVLAADGLRLEIENEGVWAVEAERLSFTPVATFSGLSDVEITFSVREGEHTLEVAKTLSVRIDPLSAEAVDQIARALSPVYVDAMAALARRACTLPPAAGIAGAITAVDVARGVWKAPANVSLQAVLAPAVDVSHADQEGLNVSTTGISVNAIRPFVGEGTLVWGARTLDGNSTDWRYISVRRTMLMIEESITLALEAFSFEANVSETWTTVRKMIENFLQTLWGSGALSGAVPDAAFFVHVGLGQTMTQDDIDQGRLIVEIGVAPARPAEFVIVRIQHRMVAP